VEIAAREAGRIFLAMGADSSIGGVVTDELIAPENAGERST
jgi:hypothetical protein